jgi:predicted RNase H-like HicB family nuclease
MTTDANAYNVSLCRTEIDGERVFEARVSELPGIVGYGDTAAEAHAMVIEAIEKLVEMAAADGEKLPEPTPRDTQYSGRITLRMSQTLHRLAKITADKEGATLNALLCERLAISLGMSAASILREPPLVQAPLIQHQTLVQLFTPINYHGEIKTKELPNEGRTTLFTTGTAASTRTAVAAGFLGIPFSNEEAESA